MRTQAELNRMTDGQWGVAITVQGQDSTDDGRWVTQTITRAMAERYATALTRGMAELKGLDPRVARGLGMRITHTIQDAQGKLFPHVATTEDFQRLISEVLRVCHEIRVRERQESRLYSGTVSGDRKDTDTTK